MHYQFNIGNVTLHKAANECLPVAKLDKQLTRMNY